VLSTLLYSSETWTLLENHNKKLNSFHQRCFRAILNIKWQYYIINIEELEEARMLNIEDTIKIRADKDGRDTSAEWQKHVSHTILPSLN
jgi:hypothetical protein